MKTTEFNKPVTGTKLAENFEKQFGTRVDLAKYDREQLEDIRNKLRTRIFQQEGSAKFNDLLTNETYQKDKAMLELLNTRIKEMLGEQMQKLRDKMAQLSEGKKAKPDFLDMDKDGNKKEPMKKAIKDKKVKEGAKPDFLDLDKDGDKKEPMKKAAKSKKVAKEEIQQEGWDDMMKAAKERSGPQPSGGAGVKKGKAYGGSAQKDKPEQKEGWDDMMKAAKERSGPQPSGGAGVKKGKAYGGSAQKDKPEQKEGWEDMMKSVKDKSGPQPSGGAGVKKGKAYGGSAQKDKPEQKESAAHAKGCDCKECMGTFEGKDEGKPGKNFAKIAKSAGKQYGSKAAGERVAGAVRSKLAKQGKLEESQFKHNVRFVNESLAFLINEDEEGKAQAITAASDMVNDFTSWMQRVGQYQTKAMIELADQIRADFGQAESEAFKQAVAPALSAALETLTQQRETISNAVAVLAGEAAPQEPMGMEPDLAGGAGMEPELDLAGPDDLNPPVGDEFGASDAATGGDEVSGRGLRESREDRRARKLAESHSLMAKLAK